MLERLRQMAARFAEIEAELADPEVLADAARARGLLRERGRLLPVAERVREHERTLREIAEAETLATGAEEAELRSLARGELEELRERARHEAGELARLLVADDPLAARDVIVEIRAGVGGDEATLFAAELFRMYGRFAERRGLSVELLSTSPSEVGGFKEIIFSVAGTGAHDALRFESGGHRVQRVPQTEAQGRIHTSLATVAVLPEADDVEVVVRPEDVEMDTFRAGGPGGQNVNKTSSAVRLTHRPSGLVVSCQDESSQHKNRAKAMRVLRARLLEQEEAKRRSEREAHRRSQVGSGDRSERIRTYNFPQNRLTDHRIKENYNLERVIEGHLDEVVDDLRRRDVEERLKALR